MNTKETKDKIKYLRMMLQEVHEDIKHTNMQLLQLQTKKKAIKDKIAELSEGLI